MKIFKNPSKSIVDNKINKFTQLWQKILIRKNQSVKMMPELQSHCLKKFYRTRLGSVINADIAEALMEHEEGLTYVHRKYTIEELASLYYMAHKD